MNTFQTLIDGWWDIINMIEVDVEDMHFSLIGAVIFAFLLYFGIVIIRDTFDL